MPPPWSATWLAALAIFTSETLLAGGRSLPAASALSRSDDPDMHSLIMHRLLLGWPEVIFRWRRATAPSSGHPACLSRPSGERPQPLPQTGDPARSAGLTRSAAPLSWRDCCETVGRRASAGCYTSCAAIWRANIHSGLPKRTSDRVITFMAADFSKTGNAEIRRLTPPHHDRLGVSTTMMIRRRCDAICNVHPAWPARNGNTAHLAMCPFAGGTVARFATGKLSNWLIARFLWDLAGARSPSPSGTAQKHYTTAALLANELEASVSPDTPLLPPGTAWGRRWRLKPADFWSNGTCATRTDYFRVPCPASAF